MAKTRETEPRLRPTEVVRQQVADEGLAAAIMDHALADGDSAEVCARLTARGIPYVSYSGYDPVKGASPDAPFVSKPASMDTLQGAVEKMLIGEGSHGARRQ